jgi:hypothetical protein
LAAAVSRGQAAGLSACFLATLSAFLAGMLGIGAEVHVYFTQGEHTTALEVLSWSVIKTVDAAFAGGVLALGVICLACSIVLPYVKITVTAACFLLPQRILSARTREKLLTTSVLSGKLSLIAAFFVVFAMRALLLVWSHATSELRVQMEIGAGLIIVLFASFASLKLGLLVLSLHLRPEETLLGEFEEPPTDRPCHRRLTGFLALTAAILFPFGVATPAFRITQGGAFGQLYALIDRPAASDFSVLDLLWTVMDMSGPPGAPVFMSRFWRVYTTVVFQIFAVLVPVLSIILTLVLASVRMKRKHVRPAYLAMLGLQGASALDVLVFVLYLARLQGPAFITAALEAQGQGLVHVCALTDCGGLQVALLPGTFAATAAVVALGFASSLTARRLHAEIKA